MKLFSGGKDGGPESKVWGYWLVEIKSLFSIALLCFEDGGREAYHNHAFNCISWVLSGGLREEILDGEVREYKPGSKPVFTYKNTFHRVSSKGRTYVLTFRGPWNKTWNEYLPAENKSTVLTHGRKVVN